MCIMIPLSHYASLLYCDMVDSKNLISYLCRLKKALQIFAKELLSFSDCSMASISHWNSEFYFTLIGLLQFAYVDNSPSLVGMWDVGTP